MLYHDDEGEHSPPTFLNTRFLGACTPFGTVSAVEAAELYNPRCIVTDRKGHKSTSTLPRLQAHGLTLATEPVAWGLEWLGGVGYLTLGGVLS